MTQQSSFDFERTELKARGDNYDPPRDEILAICREIRAESPATSDGPRECNPVSLFASRAIELSFQHLSEWSRRWDNDNVRPGEYLEMLGDAMLAHEWILEDGEPDHGAMSFSEACEQLGAFPETIRQRVLKQLPAVPVFWLVVIRGIESAFRHC